MYYVYSKSMCFWYIYILLEERQTAGQWHEGGATKRKEASRKINMSRRRMRDLYLYECLGGVDVCVYVCVEVWCVCMSVPIILSGFLTFGEIFWFMIFL